MKWLSSIFSAIAAIFGHAKHRSEIKNAPEVKKAVAAQKEIDAVSKTEKAVKKKDKKKIREELAE